VAGEDADVKIADVDAQLERVGRKDGGDASLEKILLKLAPFGRQQPPAVGLDPLFQLGVAVGDRAPETLHLLPRTAEADRADAGGRGGTDDRDRDRGRPLAEARGTGALHERRIDQVEVTARPRRAVAVDHRERTVEERLHMFAGVSDRRGAADKAGRRAVHGANAQQAAEDIGDVRPERAAVGMHLVHHDVFQAPQEIAPAAVVIGQDPRMQHVGVGDHEIRAFHDLAAFFARGVAVKGAELAGVERGFEQCAERALLVARKRLGGVEQQHAEGRLAAAVVAQDRQQKGQRLPRGRAGDEHRVLPGGNRLERLGLVRIELPDPALAEHSGEARVKSVGERSAGRLLRRHHLMRADLSFEPRAQHRLDGVDMGNPRFHNHLLIESVTRQECLV